MIDLEALDRIIEDSRRHLSDSLSIDLPEIETKTRQPLQDLPHSLPTCIDHTLLKPEARQDEIRRLCEEAVEHRFASVCVYPCRVRQCVDLLHGTGVKVCSVVGFPSGAVWSQTKAEEARHLVFLGASEIDMVINIGLLKDRAFQEVFIDIRGVVESADDACVKTIIETSLLSQEEKVLACLIAYAAGADFVKTSTGMAGGGATVGDVMLMRRVVGSAMGVKAAGGIRDTHTALSMIEAGANRIGASSGVEIVRGVRQG